MKSYKTFPEIIEYLRLLIKQPFSFKLSFSHFNEISLSLLEIFGYELLTTVMINY